ncbi:MAG: LiaF domain-containing protein [Candidatus Dojkabacteria bacterium]|jgi:predicted membrane protein
MKRLNRVLLGLFLITVGVIYGLNKLEITNINIFFDGWWTLFIIIPSFLGLLERDDFVGNVIGLLIGFSLLFLIQGFISVEKLTSLIMPTILVVIGLTLLIKNIANTSTERKIKEINKKDKPKEYSSTFSSLKLNIDDELKNLDLSATFGGIVCDIRKAIIKNDVVINTTSVFGGIEIYVPNDVEIKVLQTSIFGSVENKRKPKDEKSKKTIYINSTCIFGGVDIK